MRLFLPFISMIWIGCLDHSTPRGAFDASESVHIEKGSEALAGSNSTDPASAIHRVGKVVYEARVIKSSVKEEVRVISVVYTVFEEDVRGDYLKHLATDESDFNRLINYCAFKAQEDFTIQDASGEIFPCLNSVFERTYGLKQGATFNLVFEVPDGRNELVLKYYDRLVGNGPVRIAIL